MYGMHSCQPSLYAELRIGFEVGYRIPLLPKLSLVDLIHIYFIPSYVVFHFQCNLPVKRRSRKILQGIIMHLSMNSSIYQYRDLPTLDMLIMNLTMKLFAPLLSFRRF
jgi:hypothetical protein